MRVVLDERLKFVGEWWQEEEVTCSRMSKTVGLPQGWRVKVEGDRLWLRNDEKGDVRWVELDERLECWRRGDEYQFRVVDEHGILWAITVREE